VTYLGEDVAVGGAYLVDVAVFAVLLLEPQVLHALAFLASVAGTGSDVRTAWREQHRAGRRGHVLSATALLEGTRGLARGATALGGGEEESESAPQAEQCEPFQEGATLDQGEVKKPSSLI